MTIINYIVLSLALGIQSLVSMRNSAAEHPIELTKGLGVSSIMAVVFTLMLALGMLLGNLFSFGFEQVDHSMFLGFMILAVIKLLFSIKRTIVTGYDISSMGKTVMVAVALGINVLIVGIGIGFISLLRANIWKMAIPLTLLVFLMSMWGIMLGRRDIDIRPKRWLYIGILCLLVVMLVGYLQ